MLSFNHSLALNRVNDDRESFEVNSQIEIQSKTRSGLGNISHPGWIQ